MTTPTPPVRVAIVNDFELVVAGLTMMLAERPGVVVRRLDDEAMASGSVDVVLYDTFARRDEAHLEDLVSRSRARVVVFTWSSDAAAVDRAFEVGAAGYLSKGLGAAELEAALRRVHAGEQVTAVEVEVDDDAAAGPRGWPGQAFGLSAREAEILAFITVGLTNQEIAAATYLSINSIKTYIRSTYRKLGIERRPQAVRFGMQHGFEPRRTSAVK